MVSMVSNPEPPDGGWGWVIVICGFTNHVFTVGLMTSLSVFYVSWLDQFGENKGATSWILSIGVACMFGLSPVPASLADRFRFRVVAVVGGLLTSAGLVMSVFATSVTYLVVSIGLITGIGCCFSYFSALATVAMYFSTRRSLAMGLNTAGTGVGAFILSPVLNLLEEAYSWRGAMLILAGITLHMCVTGLLMRDLVPTPEDETMESSKRESEREEARNGLVGDAGALDSPPTAPLIMVTLDDEEYIEGYKPHVPMQDLDREDGVNDRSNDYVGSDMKRRASEMNESIRNPLARQPEPVRAGSSLHVSHGDFRKGGFLLRSDNEHSSSFPSLDSRTLSGKSSHRTITKSIQNMDLALLASVPSLLNEKNPFAKSSSQDSKSPSNNENGVGVQQNSQKRPGIRAFISTILSSKTVKENLDLLSEKAHVAYCVSNFFTNLSYLAPIVYMVDRAVHEGISKSTGALFVSANGIGNVLGRIFFGYVADRCHAKHISMYITALTVCGMSTMLSAFIGDIIFLHVTYAAFFGFLIGTYTVLAPAVCVDLTGISVFPAAYGQANFFMGVGGIIGTPIAGWLFDWTRSYVTSYLTAGVFLVVSGVMLLPLVCRSSRSVSRSTIISQEETSDAEQERPINV